MLRLVRRFIYTFTSYRPKFGTILYPPTLDFRMWWKDHIKRHGSIVVLGDGPVYTSLHTKDMINNAVLPTAEARLFPRIPAQSQQPAVQLRPGEGGAVEDGQAVIEGLDNIKDPSDDIPATLPPGISMAETKMQMSDGTRINIGQINFTDYGLINTHYGKQLPEGFKLRDPFVEADSLADAIEGLQTLGLVEIAKPANDETAQLDKISELIETLRPAENLDPRVAEDLAVVKQLYDYAPEEFTYSWEELRPRVIRRIERMYGL